MTLGTQVRYYRDKLGWTLEKLSEESGVDVGTISAIEVRKSTKSKFTASLAKAFGLTIEQLQDTARDWLEPGGPPPGDTPKAHSPVAQFIVSKWLFSDDLFAALQRKTARELAHVENVMRAHLHMPPLSINATNAEKQRRA